MAMVLMITMELYWFF